KKSPAPPADTGAGSGDLVFGPCPSSRQGPNKVSLTPALIAVAVVIGVSIGVRIVRPLDRTVAARVGVVIGSGNPIASGVGVVTRRARRGSTRHSRRCSGNRPRSHRNGSRSDTTPPRAAWRPNQLSQR